MKLSQSKGVAPRHPLLRQTQLFGNAIGPVLSHTKANNTQEVHALRAALHALNDAIYNHVKSIVPKACPHDSLAWKQQVCDSVSWLRQQYIKTSNKISKSTFGLQCNQH